MESLEEHAVMLMRKRVYDMAGVLGKTVKVALINIVIWHQSISMQTSYANARNIVQMQLQQPLQLHLTSNKCSSHVRIRSCLLLPGK